MATGLAYSHLEHPLGEPARLARLPRIRVAQIVMDYLAHGWSVDAERSPFYVKMRAQGLL